MQHELTRDALAAILAIADLDDVVVDGEYRDPTSLRRNPSTPCLAIEVPGLPEYTRFVLAAGRVLDDDHAAELFGAPQTRLGRFGNVYFWASTWLEDGPAEIAGDPSNEWDRSRDDLIGAA